MLSKESKLQIFKYLNSEISIELFEEWVYKKDELKDEVDSDSYLHLLMFNFKQKDAPHLLKAFLTEKIISEAEFDNWRIRRLLYNLSLNQDDAVDIIEQFYHLYCGGYGFLRDVGLPYIIDFDEIPKLREKALWNEQAFESKRSVVDELLPPVIVAAKHLLKKLDEGYIIIQTAGSYHLNDLAEVDELIIENNLMFISFLVAMDENRLIGADGTIPWQLPDDMGWFREKSMGKPVIMGRKTYESIPAKFRPLPNRHNIVLTRNPEYEAEGATVVHSVADAIIAAGEVDEIIIGGGTKIYKQFLPLVNRIYLTVVNGRFDGDTHLPEIDLTDWQETFRQHHSVDERHEVSFDWIVYEKGGVA